MTKPASPANAMDAFETELWAAIVAASREGRSADMMRMCGVFEAYQDSPGRLLEDPALMETVLYERSLAAERCELTHFGLAL